MDINHNVQLFFFVLSRRPPERVRALMEILQLPHILSEGQYTSAIFYRLALAAAWIHKPSLVILYEGLRHQNDINFER